MIKKQFTALDDNLHLRSHFSFFKNLLYLLVASYMTRFMHINLHFINKHDGWSTFYNDLYFDAFTADSNIDTLRSGQGWTLLAQPGQLKTGQGGK
ncbi:MAG: hypothetical protein AB2693_28305 [Candidatus Thiodiazotropha sp.]